MVIAPLFVKLGDVPVCKIVELAQDGDSCRCSNVPPRLIQRERRLSVSVP